MFDVLDPDDLTFTEATDAIRLPDWYRMNRQFYEGDHWQDGEGWSGPMPVDGESKQIARKRLKKNFTSENVIKDVVNRHTTGIIGRDPGWGFATLEEGENTDAEDEEIAELEALVRPWWNEKEVLSELQKATRRVLYAEQTVLRLFIPFGRLDTEEQDEEPGTEGSLPDGLSVDEALDMIYLETVRRDRATVYTDPASMAEVGVFHFDEPANTIKDDADPSEGVELSYLNDEDETVLRIFEQGGGDEARFTVDLGGNLTMFEMDRERIVTEQVQQQQQVVNKAHTTGSINLDWGGFLERSILNAQLPGKFVEDPKSPDGKRYEPEPLELGPGSVQHIRGLPVENEEGEVTDYKDPEIKYHEPTSSDIFDDTLDRARLTILRETNQLHAAQGWSADASGEAIRQHMADFITSLYLTKSALDPAIRWVIETVLRFAFQISDNGDSFPDGYRPTADARINSGPVPSSEIEAVVKLVKQRLISHHTALSRLGVEDVEAEMERLQDAIERSIKEEKAEIISTIAGQGGASLRGAAMFAGVDEDNVDDLLTNRSQTTVTEP